MTASVDHPTANIADAVQRLRAGELVAIPTETVYGLAADASNETAIARVFALKGRPADRPLIVHLGDAEWVSQWAREVPSYARLWMQAFWPGPLTLVLPKQPEVSGLITGGQDTVAVRVPNHPVALALLEAFGGALVAPSANRYGQISPTSAEAVRHAFGSDAPWVLDGGPCSVGIESTIVACVNETPEILRLGAISRQDLMAAADVMVRAPQPDSALIAPGQAAVHYAPQTPCRMVSRAALNAWQDQAQSVGVLSFHALGWSPAMHRVLPADPVLAAREVYAALRALDQAGLELILVEQPPQGDAWAAIRDRLQRATV